jgi:hypothetical protein
MRTLVEPCGYTNNFRYPDNIICPGSHGITVYGNPWSGLLPAGSSLRTIPTLALLGLLLVAAITSPALAGVSADVTAIPVSKDTLAQDNPEMIAALKTHVAYVGQTQDARMDGVIAYIDTISGGTGSANLRGIKEDYMAVASSIPLMQKSEEISEARWELQRQSRLFVEETKLQIVAFNGSTDAMRDKAATSIQTVEKSITNLKESLWLSKDTARLTVFNREAEQRSKILQSLSSQGVDVSRARDISQQIDGHRTDIQKALTDKSVAALKSANTGLKLMNREFRTTVQGYQNGLQIEMKRNAILSMK